MSIEGDYVNGPRCRQKRLALGTLVVGFTLPLWLVAEAQGTQVAASVGVLGRSRSVDVLLERLAAPVEQVLVLGGDLGGEVGRDARSVLSKLAALQQIDRRGGTG